MKYVCLGYIEEGNWDSLPEADGQQVLDECFEYDDELRSGGHFLGGEALGSSRAAVTLRIKNGQVDVTDGPYAETKEVLGGILLLEARDLNHAIALMSKHPGVKMGPFEIRPADEQINSLIAKRGVAFAETKQESTAAMPAKNTICLWYDGDAEEAARFYAETFPNSSIGAVHRAPGDYPAGKKGDVLTVEFTVMGMPCIGLNGGPGITHNMAFSFQVATVNQAETDRYWNAIVSSGGKESQCGWCKDRWGLNWQITPVVLSQGVTNPNPAVAKRVFEAMMTMQKIEVAAIEAAVRG
ncbi:MAG: VOC family protein [Rubripirellula sp.]